MAFVLVIDDDRAVRALLRQSLERAGHQVDEAADGEAGMRACRLKTYEVVLCDLLMPGKEGIETIPQLRKEHPAARIIAMSGGEAVHLGIALRLGAWRCLSKPFASAELLHLVEVAVAAQPSAL